MNLNQITVPVKDINASIDFYQKLGLRLIVHTNDHYARFECTNGDSASTFSIHKVDTLPAGNGIWVYFEVPDVDAAVEEMSAKGLQFAEPAEDKKWLWRETRLKDLDGNQIIVYHAGTNRRHPPWRKDGA
ncbi:MAG: VOC family protein [Terriglobus roseus]|nr:VOC family protein [Terriglobus roseus]